MKDVRISMVLVLGDDADPEAIVERLFEFLCADPDGLFPEIETVDGYTVAVLPPET